MVLQFPPSQALVLAPQAGPALLRRPAQQSAPDKLTKERLAVFRVKVVASINACIREGREKGRTSEQSQEHLLAEYALGFSYVQWMHGKEGEQNWDKFEGVISYGRKLKKELLTGPLVSVRRGNAADPADRDEVFSGAVDYALSPVYKGDLDFSRTSSGIVQSMICDDYHELQACKAALESLEKLLALKEVLGVDRHVVRRAKASSEESGLVNLIGETNKKVSYLEAAVFCAVFAKRHGLQTDTPVTMKAEYARQYLADLGDSYEFSKGMMAEYRKACVQCFPEHVEEAWTLLKFYLEEATDVIRMHRGKIGKHPALAELFFPTGRVSAAALAKPKRTKPGKQ